MKALDINLRVSIFVLLLLLFSQTVKCFESSNDKKEFVKIVDFLPSNFVTDGSINYTAILQKVIDENSNVIFPDFPVLIDYEGLQVKSNSHLKFSKDGPLILKANDKTHYSMLHIENVDNVIIEDVILVGDRRKHKGSEGEWGMGIYIKGGENIVVRGAKISNCWGDGVDITRSSKRNSENIEITNCVIEECRRNGVTIGSGENILIKDVTIRNINGTLPMAGICVEPNNNKDFLGTIVSENVRTQGCNVGVHIGLSRYPSSEPRKVDLLIKNLKSVGDNHGILVGDFFRKHQYAADIMKMQGTVKFQNIAIEKNKKDPIKYYSQKGYEYAPRFVFENIKLGLVLSGTTGSSQPSVIKQLKARGFDVKDFNGKKFN